MLRDDGVIVFDFVLVGILLFFLLLRLYVRTRILRKFEASDVLVCVAWSIFVGKSVSDTLTSAWGFWNPAIKFSRNGVLPDLEKYIPDKKRLKSVLILVYATQPFSLCILYLIKFSFLLLYRQIFPLEMRRLRLALNITSAFILVAFILTIVTTLVWCVPVSRNWTMNPAERCMNVAIVPRYFAANLLNIVTDLLVYGLPFSLLPTLKRSRGSSTRKLVGIVSMMSLGFLPIVCLVGRIASTGGGTSGYEAKMWGTAEQGSAILVACCPPLRYLFMRRRGSSSRSQSSNPPKPSHRVVTDSEGATRTRTAWRFWRMADHTPGEVENTLDPNTADWTVTGVLSGKSGTHGMISTRADDGDSFGGGLTPAPRPRPSVAVHAPVSSTTDRRDPVDGTGGAGGVNAGDGRGKRFRDKVGRKQSSQTSPNASRGGTRGWRRRMSDTFGGTQSTMSRAGGAATILGSRSATEATNEAFVMSRIQNDARSSPATDDSFLNTGAVASRPVSGLLEIEPH